MSKLLSFKEEIAKALYCLLNICLCLFLLFYKVESALYKDILFLLSVARIISSMVPLTPVPGAPIFTILPLMSSKLLIPEEVLIYL